MDKNIETLNDIARMKEAPFGTYSISFLIWELIILFLSFLCLGWNCYELKAMDPKNIFGANFLLQICSMILIITSIVIVTVGIYKFVKSRKKWV